MTNSTQQKRSPDYAYTQDKIRKHMQATGADKLDAAGLKEWALKQGYSWDADNEMPEPICGSCGSPMNVWDGEEACSDCDDCEDCCWENHGGDPHKVSC